MRLRKLVIEDAPLMLEWMHDCEVTKYLKTDFDSLSLDDAKRFILCSSEDDKNIHLAIVSDDDEYMGTVSLKNIDRVAKCAEFGISIRKCAMGLGYSWFGMTNIVEKAFRDMRLDVVYWCVSKDNVRALRFYDKHNFHETIDIPEFAQKRYENMDNLKWYSVLKGDKLVSKDSIVGCRILHLKTISTVGTGQLSFFEENRDINFDIKRIYYITKVPEGEKRGFHDHRELKQLLFCPYGCIKLILENELGREEIELSDPSIGIVIDRPTWREMYWVQTDSVLCVAASDFYDPSDYIREYGEFKKFIFPQ